MNGDDMLNRYAKLTKQVEHLEIQIAEYLERMTAPKSAQISNDGGYSNSISDPVGDAAAKLADLEYDYFILKTKQWRLNIAIFNIIQEMSDCRYIRFMYLRYLKHETIAAIAEDIGCTAANLYRIRPAMLEEFNRLAASE